MSLPFLTFDLNFNDSLVVEFQFRLTSEAVNCVWNYILNLEIHFHLTWNKSRKRD